MSGLSGIYHFGSGKHPEINQEIDTMRGAMAAGGVNSMQHFVQGRAGLGIVNANDVLTADFYEDSELSVVFNGRLYKRPPGPGLENETDSDAAAVAGLFRFRKEKAVDFLQGIFACAVYEKASGHLWLFTDRHGYELLYYYQDSDRLLFSTSAKSILKAFGTAPAPDFEGICDTINFGTVFGNRSPFENIRILPHAAMCRAVPETFEIQQYWDYPMHPDIRPDTRAELMAEAKDRIENAVLRTLAGSHAGVMLSGGLDSRLIAAVAKKQANSLRSFSFEFDEPDPDERAISGEIARDLGIANERYSLGNQQLIDSIRRNLIDSDGENAFIDILDRIIDISKAYPGICLLNGFLLDTLFKSGWAFFPQKGFEQVNTEQIIRRYSTIPDYLIDRIYAPDFAHTLKRKKRERVAESISGLPSDQPLEVTTRFYCLNRARRFINSSFRAFGKYLYLALPGTDYDLTDFALRLPYGIRSNSGFYRELICSWVPEVCQARWDKTDRPLIEGDIRDHPRLEKLLFKARYACQRLTRGRVDLLNPHASFNRQFRRDKQFREGILEVLYDPQSLNRGYLGKKHLDQLVSAQDNGKDYDRIFKAHLKIEMLHRIF